MAQFTSPASTPAGMPVVNQAHIGKQAGGGMHFPTRAAFDAAIAASTTTGLWAVGQPMTISGEPSSCTRLWNGTHARTVIVGGIRRVVLAANANAVLSTTGMPDAGVGANGDLAVDEATNTYYGPKASGAWHPVVPVTALAGRGMVLAQTYAASGVGSTASPYVSASGTGTLQEAGDASYLAANGRTLSIQLGDAEYRVTAPIAFAGVNRVSLVGTGAAWANDPNAEARPDSGSMLVLSGQAMAAFVVGQGSGNTFTGFTVWGRGRNYNATYNNAASGYNAGIRINARNDKLKLDRLFIGRCHVGLQVETGSQLDVWTMEDMGLIGNWYGVYLRDNSGGGSIMSNWSRLTISDNDGPGFLSEVLMYRNKISGCNIVRNCRGMTGGGAQMTVFGPGTIVTLNDFSEAGLVASVDQTGFGFDDTGAVLVQGSQRPNIDDLRVRGEDVQVFGNQFTNHLSAGGACVHVMADAVGTYIGPNQWRNNTALQIKIDAGATGTTIVMAPGLSMAKISDAGTNTRYVAHTGMGRDSYIEALNPPPSIMQTAKLWVSADKNRTMSGSNLTVLRNRLDSGGFDATADSTPKPTLATRPNGLTALNMTNGSYLTFPSDASYKTPTHTIYFVGSSSAGEFRAMVAIPNELGAHDAPYQRVALYRADADTQYASSATTDGTGFVDFGYLTADVHAYCLTTADMTLYNEANVGDQAGPTAGPFTHTYPNPTACRIGANGIGEEQMNGTFCEMAMFSGTHNADQRAAVIAYMKRWL